MLLHYDIFVCVLQPRDLALCPGEKRVEAQNPSCQESSKVGHKDYMAFAKTIIRRGTNPVRWGVLFLWPGERFYSR